MNDFGSIVPVRYVPPFLRNQFVAEEVINFRRQLVGHYNPAAIPDCQVSYRDRVSQQRITLMFNAGEIIMIAEGEV